MRIAIEILATNAEPSVSNVSAMKSSFINLAKTSKSLKNSFDFFVYTAGTEHSRTIEDDSLIRLQFPYPETIYSTYEKGVSALKEISGYDWYIRMNISCFLNIPLLDYMLPLLDEDIVYCNAINSYINDENYYNDIYPRGDFMLFSEKTRQGILSVCDKYLFCDEALTNRINIPHVDDCLFGLCLIDYFGPTYFKHLQMLNYNYIPEPTTDITRPVSILCPTSRVKTNPPGINYSGYSWSDNEYRRYDGKKMIYLNNQVKGVKYHNIELSSLFSNSRPTLFIRLSNQPIEVFNRYLESKNRDH